MATAVERLERTAATCASSSPDASSQTSLPSAVACVGVGRGGRGDGSRRRRGCRADRPRRRARRYTRVNYEGTKVILEACAKHGVPKLVFSSSPSTRFTGADVDGLREDEMPSLPLPHYLQEYAATKARAELEVAKACRPGLLTVSVAPHQVDRPSEIVGLCYGLRDASTPTPQNH